MNWPKAVYNSWQGAVSNREAKEELGRRIALKVEDGQVIGVGSGSTAAIAIQKIAERVKSEGLRVTAICTSAEVTLACAALDLPVGTLLQYCPDWSFDGADEVDGERNMIKGRGGAMFLEKIVMRASPRNYILVDRSKLVARLGEKFAIPVEVLPMALRVVERELARMGTTEQALRLAAKKDGPEITENGNLILDVRFPRIGSSLERDLAAIPGVIASGLFMGRDIELVVA
jgi:ribose 5-phosphate isomerase A